MFDKRTQELVALIRKKRPDWQAGKVNGVGGKIERGEKAHAAMVREFQEETGVKTAATAWELFFLLDDEAHGYRVYYYRSFGDLSKLRSTTEEEIEVWSLEDTQCKNQEMICNLSWLIPMALDTTFKDGEGVWRN